MESFIINTILILKESGLLLKIITYAEIEANTTLSCSTLEERIHEDLKIKS
jgi:hypothetical protein